MVRRKDNKNRVLKEGEYQRANGTFEYKWTDKKGKRHSTYAKTLEELREKENDVLRDILDGIKADKNRIALFTNLSLTAMIVCRAIPDTLPLFVPEVARETVDFQIEAIIDRLQQLKGDNPIL